MIKSEDSLYIALMVFGGLIIIAGFFLGSPSEARQSYSEYEYTIGTKEFNVIEFPSVNNPNLICIYIYQPQGGSTLQCGGR